MSADGSNIRLIVELLDGAAQLGLRNACGYMFFLLPLGVRPALFMRCLVLLHAKSGGVEVRYQNVGFRRRRRCQPAFDDAKVLRSPHPP